MGPNEVFCPLWVGKTVVLRQRDHRCRGMTDARGVGLPDGVNCPYFHNLNLSKLREGMGQRCLVQFQLGARRSYNHDFKQITDRLTGEVRDRVTNYVQTVWRRNHNG